MLIDYVKGTGAGIGILGILFLVGKLFIFLMEQFAGLSGFVGMILLSSPLLIFVAFLVSHFLSRYVWMQSLRRSIPDSGSD